MKYPVKTIVVHNNEQEESFEITIDSEGEKFTKWFKDENYDNSIDGIVILRSYPSYEGQPVIFKTASIYTINQATMEFRNIPSRWERDYLHYDPLTRVGIHIALYPNEHEVYSETKPEYNISFSIRCTSVGRVSINGDTLKIDNNIIQKSNGVITANGKDIIVDTLEEFMVYVESKLGITDLETKEYMKLVKFMEGELA